MNNEITIEIVEGGKKLTHPSGTVQVILLGDLQDQLTSLQGDDAERHAEIAALQSDIDVINAFSA